LNQVLLAVKMALNVLNYLKIIKATPFRSSCNPSTIADQVVLRKHLEDPEFPFLVSFPRTGSHWLRMLLELYFERPLLTRTFFFPEKDNYLLLHTHDLELDVKRHNVMYIYRDPVDTIYSQIKYHKEDSKDRICNAKEDSYPVRKIKRKHACGVW
jgi:hypothetical protein